MAKAIKSSTDIETNELYFPTEAGNAYLGDDFLSSISSQVRNRYADADEIIRCIEDVERIHKRGVCSEINNTEAKKQMESISINYRNRHQKWLHHEEAYIYFYNLLNGKNVF